MCLLIIDLSPMEGQVICLLGHGLNLADVWAVSAGNPSQPATLVLVERVPGEFTQLGDGCVKVLWSPADSLRGILAQEGLWVRRKEKILFLCVW